MNHPKLKAIEKKPARITRKPKWYIFELYNVEHARKAVAGRVTMEELIDYLLATYVHASRANKKGGK